MSLFGIFIDYFYNTKQLKNKITESNKIKYIFLQMICQALTNLLELSNNNQNSFFITFQKLTLFN